MITVCFVTFYNLSVGQGKWGGATRIIELMKNLKSLSDDLEPILIGPKKITVHDLYSVDYPSYRRFDFLENLRYIGVTEAFNPFRLRTIVKTIRNCKADLIQSEEIWGSLALPSISKRLKTPLILDEHICEAEYAKTAQLSLIVQIYTKWLERKVSHAANHVLTVSVRDKQIASRFYNIPPEKITVIPNGVDTSRFKPVSPQEQRNLKEKIGFSGKFVIIFHGRLDYPPNAEAVKYIVDYISPYLLVSEIIC